MKTLWIILRLLYKNKIIFIPWYFAGRGGSACYSIVRYQWFGINLEVRLIGMSFLKCPDKLCSVLHEIGHIHHHRCIDFFTRGTATYSILNREMYASKYAIRVLKLLGKDTQTRRQWLCWAYGTYLAHFNKKGELGDIARDSYASVRKFGVNFKEGL